MQTELQALLIRHLDGEDDAAAALSAACDVLRQQPVDVDALLTWVRDYRAEPARRSTALMALRRTLGLRPMAAAVCATPSRR